MTTTTLTVPDISCGHCKESIEGAVADIDGVAAVEVDIEPRTVNLSYDESRVALDDIKAAIHAVGYEVAAQS